MEAHLAHEDDLSQADDWPARPSAAHVRAHQLRLVDSAIRLVASGGAPSVTVVGVRGGRDMLAHALSEAARGAVLVRARWWAEGDVFDLVVEWHG